MEKTEEREHVGTHTYTHAKSHLCARVRVPALAPPSLGTLTMGLSKKGKPCMVRRALVDAAVSLNTTQACPLNRSVFKHTTSKIFPNWLKMAYMHFRSSVCVCMRVCV